MLGLLDKKIQEWACQDIQSLDYFTEQMDRVAFRIATSGTGWNGKGNGAESSVVAG